MKKSLKSTGGGPPHPPLDPETERIVASLDDHEVELPTNLDSESQDPLIDDQDFDAPQDVAEEVEIENSDW